MISRQALGLGLCAFLLLLSGCIMGPVDPTPDAELLATEQVAVDKAVGILLDCPAWSDISFAQDDVAPRRKILAAMDELSQFDLDVLRAAIEEYILNLRQRDQYDITAMSRLYVLNRYIFAVPEKVPMGSLSFGSFVGVPYDDQYVNELWPLSVDAAGNLELTGTFAGYFGAPYPALEEFDYFRDAFGTRK